MTKINLLPWRDEERKVQKKLFTFHITLTIVLALFLVIILNLYYLSLIGEQHSRNKYLTAQIYKEQVLLVNLNQEQKNQRETDKQLHFMVSLREQSYNAVRLLDELARIVPEGVFFSKVSRDINKITIFGKAKSNLEVTQLMKNIDKSLIFDQPNLSVLNAEAKKTEAKSFELTIMQSTPKQ